MNPVRRTVLRRAAAAVAAAAVSPAIVPAAWAQSTPTRREFQPQANDWRTFDLTTRVDVAEVMGTTDLWLPVPSIERDWQRSVGDEFSTNGQARLMRDGRYGARYLWVQFAADERKPWVELTSRVQTRNRVVDWTAKPAAEDAETLRFWLQPTHWIPTDGIVAKTAQQATRGATTDLEKVRRIYEWVVTNTFRDPKTRGCGEGDIKTMLETGNLGGKCADLNAIFVGLCRASGVPARDVYGVRVAPSAFGYQQLGAPSASLQGAQHCRAEVYLRGHGWLPMDPADVTKVMRMETPEWIKTPDHPLVASVNHALFGNWEGNWVGWNMAHDLKLPQAQGGDLGFLMYPEGESGGQRLDHYAPDQFRYRISARELTA